jgi:hypothetical protein
MEDYDKRINNLEQWKASLENAIIQGRALGYAPPLLNPPEKEVAALLPVGNLPHFQLRRDDREVLAVLHGLKHLEWSLRKVKQEGVFVGEVVACRSEGAGICQSAADAKDSVEGKIPSEIVCDAVSWKRV